MILGKKRKFENLKMQYDKLGDDRSTYGIMELSDKNSNIPSNLVSTLFQKSKYENEYFIIDTQQLKLLTEMYLINPRKTNFQHLEIMSSVFYDKVQEFVGVGSKFNQDRILMCKVFLGEQYKHYQGPILKINRGNENGEFGDLDNVINIVLNLAKDAGRCGYTDYGIEILGNIQCILKGHKDVTNKMLEDIKLCVQTLQNKK